MRRILDIDLYRNGFDTRYIDCIQTPIAAAAGFFDYNNYFYYCFLHSLRGNYENYNRIDILTYANKILCAMGLKMERVNCASHSIEQVISKITELVLSETPVLWLVKYNSLFYNQYYKDRTYGSNHAIVINGVNESNQTFFIKEGSLLRDIDAFENQDVLFSLPITFQLFKDIWEDSNSQFRSANLSFADSIYFLHPCGEGSLDTNKTLQLSLSMLANGQNDLINIIDAFDGSREFNNGIMRHRLRFSGCLKPIFHLILEQCEKRKMDRSVVEKVKIEVENIRDNVVNILNRMSLRSVKMTDERKAELCGMVLDSDKQLEKLIKSLIIDEVDGDVTYNSTNLEDGDRHRATEKVLHNDSTTDITESGMHFDGDRQRRNEIRSLTVEAGDHKETYFYVDIKDHYNNQAFEEALRDDSTADFTGNGTHYIRYDAVVNQEWTKLGYSFYYDYTPGKCDNVSCNGQEITVPNLYASFLSILGCAEFGSYNEEFVIEYSDQSKQSITVDFSDFYQQAAFGETLYWEGEAGYRRNGKAIYQNYNARLFAKKYEIKPGRIVKITLPNRKNAHIFALTLTAVQ